MLLEELVVLPLVEVGEELVSSPLLVVTPDIDEVEEFKVVLADDAEIDNVDPVLED